MIRVRNLSKSYGETQVLKNISIDFPRTGLVVIYGPSGCGKTTFFNCVAGLIDFEGSIDIDGTHIELLGEKNKSFFRLKNIGFIFQDFKLFSNDSTYNNVLFPLEVSNACSMFKKNRKAHDLLSLVGLADFSNRPIKKLSGGEKQRVAIARALCNDPKIILADEPTGSLDYKNGENIMDLLSKIAQKSLVIVISHSKELTKKYADEVIEMKDGKISNHYFFQRDKHTSNSLLIVNEYSPKKPSLPSSFLLKHTFASIKERKWRTIFCNFVTSLGLIGIGLAITISSSISDNIKEAYSSVMGESKIVLSLPNKQSQAIKLEGGSYLEAIEVTKKYDDFIDDIGVIYVSDLYNQFKTANLFTAISNGHYDTLGQLSASDINEFKWLDHTSEDFYPAKPPTLNDDEVVLGLNLPMVQSLCYSFQITRTVESLSDYLLCNDVYIVFECSNADWEYDDEEVFLLKAFSLEVEPTIYHYNHLWNEYVFESLLSFPSSSSLSYVDPYPWTLKKLCYFHIRDYKDELISKLHYDQELSEYVFELGNYTYFPFTYDYDTLPSDVDKLLFFLKTSQNINAKIADYVVQDEPSLSNPIYGNSGSYLIVPSAMMMGFSNYSYFSFDEDLLSSQLDIYSTLSFEDMVSVVEPIGMLCGHYSKSLQNGVKFAVIPEDFALNSIDEVFVSTGFINAIKCNDNPIGKQLYFSYLTNEQKYGIGVVREYKTFPLIVKGIIESNDVAIYQNSDWLLTYFQTRFGLSSFSLQVNSIAFDLDDPKKSDEVIKILKRDFPQYEFVNPMSSINESVDDVCSKLRVGVICFSIIATLISTILLAVTNYLHILEIKQDIGLSRCVGITKYESVKFLLTHSVIMCLISFILSVFEILVVSFVTSQSVARVLHTSLSFSFNPLAIMVMFILALFLSIFTALLVAIPFLKLSPLDQLKH